MTASGRIFAVSFIQMRSGRERKRHIVCRQSGRAFICQGRVMRVVLQRTGQASVSVDGQILGQIEKGYVLLVGITESDDERIVEKMAMKIHDLRIFEDEQGKMNLSIEQIGGSVLSISQFTLYANCRKGRRPSFDQAARPQQARLLYEVFNEALRKTGLSVETGIFGAHMKVELMNDGPVTLVLDSSELF